MRRRCDERRREAEATGWQSGNRVSFLLVFGLHAGELLHFGRTVGKEPDFFAGTMFLLQEFLFFWPLKKRNMERNSFFGGIPGGIPQDSWNWNLKKRNPKRNAQPRMAGELIGLLRLLRLRDILRATIASKKFKDTWEKHFGERSLFLKTMSSGSIYLHCVDLSMHQCVSFDWPTRKFLRWTSFIIIFVKRISYLLSM